MKWRRDRDSNPGRLLHLAGFQDQCIQPLCHPSSDANDDEVSPISQQISVLTSVDSAPQKISPTGARHRMISFSVGFLLGIGLTCIWSQTLINLNEEGSDEVKFCLV